MKKQKEKPSLDALKVTNAQVYPVKAKGSKTLAMARVVLNEQLQLTGLRVVDGVNGYFVSYPIDPTYQGEDYHSIYYPLQKELREEIEFRILQKYQEVMES